MAWKSWLFILLGVPLIMIVGLGVLRPPSMTPLEVVERVERNMQSVRFDEIIGLRELSFALEEAVRNKDHDAVLAALKLRVNILIKLSSWDQARAALDDILEVYLPDDPDFICQLAMVEVELGEVDTARDRLAQLVGDQPEHMQAWALLGGLLLERSQEIAEEAELEMTGLLVREEAPAAIAILDGLCARRDGDPERATLEAALRNLVGGRDDSSVEQALKLAVESSTWAARARATLARAMTSENVDTKSLARLLELFLRAGRSELAAEIGLIARRIPDFSKDLDSTRQILRALQASGRTEEVGFLLEEWDWESTTDTAFVRDSCKILYELGHWNVLEDAARVLRDSDKHLGMFYFGMASCEIWRGLPDSTRSRRKANLYSVALDSLGSFARELEGLEPVPEARAKAWLKIAELHGAKDLGENATPRLQREKNDRERRALESMVAIMEPEDVPSESWERLVELMLAGNFAGHELPEERMTWALANDPKRTQELFPRWEELGQKRLRTATNSIPALYSRAVSESLGIPSGNHGPYARWRIGRMHIEKGTLVLAVQVAKQLVSEFPGLLPAIDLAIDAHLALGQERSAARMLVNRIVAVGRDDESIIRLELFSEDIFESSELLELVRSDPEQTGRLAIARHLMQAGELERAVQCLTGSANMRIESSEGLGADTRPEEALLLAEALSRLERPTEAALVARSVTPHPHFGARARILLVESLVASGDLDAARDAVTILCTPVADATHVEADAEDLLELCDALFRRGHGDLARPILAFLDSSPTMRSGEVSLRIALLAAAGGADKAAIEALDRAEPYITDGRVELVRLLFAVDQRDWYELPHRAAELRDSGFDPTPLEDTILALLEERLEVGLEMAAEGMANEPESADWAICLAAAQLLSDREIELPVYHGRSAGTETVELLTGTRAKRRDPRSILAILLTLDRSGWRAFGAQRVLEMRGDGLGVLWTLYLTGRAMVILGRPDDALSAYEAIERRFSDFGPAWDRRLEIVRSGTEDPYSEPVVTLASARIEALTRRVTGETEAEVVRAARLALEGNLTEAVGRLKRVHEQVAEDPSSRPPGLDIGEHLLARLYARRGKPAQAATEMLRICEELPVQSDHELVRELVDLVLQRQPTDKRARSVSRELGRLVLNRLAARFPEDPLVELALAIYDFEQEDRNPGLALQQAERRLFRFRERTKGKPLDALRSGSSERWIRWLIARSPRSARMMVERDLESMPGNPDLWFLMAECHEALGNLPSALTQYRQLVAMTSDPRAHLGLAALLARRGAELEEVERHLSLAEGRRRADRSPRAVFVRSLAQLEVAPRVDGLVDEALSELWLRRDEIEEDLPTFLLGRTLTRLHLQARNERLDEIRQPSKTGKKLTPRERRELFREVRQSVLDNKEESETLVEELTPYISDRFEEQMVQALSGLNLQRTAWELGRIERLEQGRETDADRRAAERASRESQATSPTASRGKAGAGAKGKRGPGQAAKQQKPKPEPGSEAPPREQREPGQAQPPAGEVPLEAGRANSGRRHKQRPEGAAPDPSPEQAQPAAPGESSGG